MEQIFRKPPLVVIEIVSPQDRFCAMQSRIDDYVAFGVPNIWVIDAGERNASICSRWRSMYSKDLVLRSTDGAIVLPLPEIFESIPQ
jgi:Uma2 family endonuclease